MAAFGWGAVVAVLGGLIGLGGAEFRLPVLLSVFGLTLLLAVVANLVLSLVTVSFSLVFRAGLTGIDAVLVHGVAVLPLLAGSLVGAHLGAGLATRIDERRLTRVVSALLGLLGLVLMAHPFMALNGLAVEGPVRAGIGIVAGVGIGLVSSLLGLAGGELIIPTLVLQHGFDIELAGSLSLAISIPTVILGLIRYQRRGQLERLASLRPLLLWMAAGSTLGALVGALLLPWVSSLYLHLLLGAVLLASAMRLARH